MDFILFILGSTFIFIGSNLLIDYAKLIALSLGIPSFIIGLTLVAFGTSLPELVVSIMASFNEEGQIVLGNVVGSNIANIALVLSIIAIWKTIQINYIDLKDSLLYVIISSVMLSIAIAFNSLTLVPGLGFLLLFFLYIYHQFKVIKRNNYQDSNKKSIDFEASYLIYSFIGVSLLGIGSNLFINGAIGVANFFGIPLIIISLSIVALGTSIPELATSLIAIKKDEPNLVIGNILGSNIINLVLVLGSSIIINPINVYNGHFSIIYNVFIALIFMIIVTILLLFIIFFKKEITRGYGLILFLIYLIFIYYNFI